MMSIPPPKSFHDLSFQKKRFFRLLKNLGTHESDRIQSAYAMAKNAHQAQLRDDGTPYILHPLRATISLLEECGVTDPDILCAMLLHDVVEDTSVSIDIIKNQFGPRVALLVNNVTRPRLAHDIEKDIRENKIKKFTWLLSADQPTRLIKSADLLDNIRSWPNIPESNPSRKKFPRWFEETITYGLPLAQKTNDTLFCEMQRAYMYSKETIIHNTCAHCA